MMVHGIYLHLGWVDTVATLLSRGFRSQLEGRGRVVGAHILNIVRCDLQFVPFVFLGHPSRYTLHCFTSAVLKMSTGGICFTSSTSSTGNGGWWVVLVEKNRSIWFSSYSKKNFCSGYNNKNILEFQFSLVFRSQFSNSLTHPHQVEPKAHRLSWCSKIPMDNWCDIHQIVWVMACIYAENLYAPPYLLPKEVVAEEDVEQRLW